MTIELKVGGTYRTRDGREIECTAYNPKPYWAKYGYPDCEFTVDGVLYQQGGRFADNNHDTLSDIVEEIAEAAAPLTAMEMAAILPTGSQERKDTPIYSGVMAYFPRAMAYIAKVSKVGNDKHNPGEPLHWSRGKSNDHADCVARHLIEHGTVDAEDGLRHSGKLAWRALALLEEELEKAQ